MNYLKKYYIPAGRHFGVESRIIHMNYWCVPQSCTGTPALYHSFPIFMFQCPLIFALVFLRFFTHYMGLVFFPRFVVFLYPRRWPESLILVSMVISIVCCSVLANSSRIYDYLDEHEREIRNVVGECILSFTLFIRHLGILIVSLAVFLKHRSRSAEIRCALHRE